MGVVGLPCRVTGLAAISISEEITFICFFQGRENSSQYGEDRGLNCRLTRIRTVLSGMMMADLCSTESKAAPHESRRQFFHPRLICSPEHLDSMKLVRLVAVDAFRKRTEAQQWCSKYR